MIFLYTRTTLSLLFFFFCSTLCLAESIHVTKGTAYSDFASKKIVYFEEHRGFFTDSGIVRSENDYFDINRKKIAELVSDYSKSKYMPTYVFRDLRNGEEEGLKLKDGKYFVFRKVSGSNIEEKIIEPKNSTFSCQGWHYFILENMEKIGQENIHLNLLFPGKLDEYRFSIKKISTNENLITLRLEFENWFIRLFAPYLELQYDKTNRKLVSFRGPSNIPDDKGKLQKVTVIYE